MQYAAIRIAGMPWQLLACAALWSQYNAPVSVVQSFFEGQGGFPADNDETFFKVSASSITCNDPVHCAYTFHADKAVRGNIVS